jgi:hypothetical protein
MPKPAPVLPRVARLLALAAILSACDADDITGGGGGGGENLNPPTSGSLARFNVDLRAAGSFRPGQPVQLTMSVSALLPTSDATVDLVLPELAQAELRGGWDRYQPTRGGALRPLASRRQALGRGATTQHQASVTFPRPGYYSVWASVSSADSAFVGGQPVQNTEVKALYVWISETGGKVMEEFDPTLLPDDAVPGLGPLRSRSARAAQSRQPRDGQMQQTAGTFEVIIDYYHPIDSMYVNVPDADYKVDAYTSAGALQGSYTGRTNASGAIIINCGAGYRFNVSVWARNPRVTVTSAASTLRTGALISSATYYSASSCGYPEWPDATPNVSHVFNQMNIVANNAASFFGYARPQANVLLVNESAQPYSSYCPTTAYLGCTPGNDFIRINTYTGSTYGQQVYGSNGVWTQAHEYGHAYHEKALGGYVEQFWKSAGCPSNHPISTATKLGCAYPEGFADYFAVATRGDATGYEYGFEISFYYLGVSPRPADGSVVEGAVGAFLYDITDSNRYGPGTAGGQLDEAHDAVAYPGRLVAEVMRTCEVTESGVWKRASGIDHIVHCLEKAVYPAITGSTTYFPSRSPDPTAQRATTTVTWDAAQIRKLWLKNLYNRTTL